MKKWRAVVRGNTVYLFITAITQHHTPHLSSVLNTNMKLWKTIFKSTELVNWYPIAKVSNISLEYVLLPPPPPPHVWLFRFWYNDVTVERWQPMNDVRRDAMVKGVEHISTNFLVNICVTGGSSPAGSISRDLNTQKLRY